MQKTPYLGIVSILELLCLIVRRFCDDGGKILGGIYDDSAMSLQ
jgi:hypothetical protein